MVRRTGREHGEDQGELKLLHLPSINQDAGARVQSTHSGTTIHHLVCGLERLGNNNSTRNTHTHTHTHTLSLLSSNCPPPLQYSFVYCFLWAYDLYSLGFKDSSWPFLLLTQMYCTIVSRLCMTKNIPPSRCRFTSLFFF